MKKIPYVSHRARGFGRFEQSGESFRNAFAAGVTEIEFDIRITADGIPVIHHDASIKRVLGHGKSIAEESLAILQKCAGKSGGLNNLLSLEELPDLLDEDKKHKYRLFIDIKDSGGETGIIRMIEKSGLTENIIIVSWLPEVLFEIHKIHPGIQLCFSHHFLPSAIVRLLFSVVIKARAAAGMAQSVYSDISLYTNRYNEQGHNNAGAIQRGKDIEHMLTSPPTGRLADILKAAGAYVCLHHTMISEKSYRLYTDAGFRIIPYSINTYQQLSSLPSDAVFPYILTDNPAFALEASEEKKPS